MDNANSIQLVRLVTPDNEHLLTDWEPPPSISLVTVVTDGVSSKARQSIGMSGRMIHARPSQDSNMLLYELLMLAHSFRGYTMFVDADVNLNGFNQFNELIEELLESGGNALTHNGGFLIVRSDYLREDSLWMYRAHLPTWLERQPVRNSEVFRNFLASQPPTLSPEELLITNAIKLLTKHGYTIEKPPVIEGDKDVDFLQENDKPVKRTRRRKAA